jgi:hypothetical protein
MSAAIPIEPIVDLSSTFQDWMLNTVRSPEHGEHYDIAAVAKTLIGDFEALLMVSSEVRVDFSVSQVDDGSDDITVVESTSGDDELLELIRATRKSLDGSFNRRFVSELRGVDSVLASEFEKKRSLALPLFAEFEKLLIALGAGTDEDAELIMGMIPSVDDLGLTG